MLYIGGIFLNDRLLIDFTYDSPFSHFRIVLYSFGRMLVKQIKLTSFSLSWTQHTSMYKIENR